MYKSSLPVAPGVAIKYRYLQYPLAMIYITGGGVICMLIAPELEIQEKIAEIERLVREFKEKFEAGISDPDKFISINEIERLWGELSGNTNSIYSDIIQTLMSSASETEMIRKKKESTETKESV
jgi:hypothetical protein